MVTKNDIGDVTTFYMLKHDKIVKPTTWKSTSRHLSAAALKSLNQHCPLTQRGKFLTTSKNKPVPLRSCVFTTRLGCGMARHS